MSSSISNPRHSRPIDVHRWSDHPEAIRLASTIWTEHFADFEAKAIHLGPKPKTSFSNQLKVLILDLYVAWLDDPTLSIGLPMSPNGWDSNSRYNALHLSKKIIELVKRLHEHDLLDLATGSYGGPYAPTNRTTRIRASTRLQEIFAGVKLCENDIEHNRNQECIVLKGSDDPEAPGQLINYEETPETTRLRSALQRYNLLLQRSFVDIPTLELPRIETKLPDSSATLDLPISIGSSRKFVRRIFSRGSWNLNGRYYGGWWQQVGKEWRSRIFINDEPTVEVDFKGMHVAILGIEAGAPLIDDPYELPLNTIAEFPAELQRKVVKKLLLTAINAKDYKSAFASCRESFPTGHAAKQLTNDQLSKVLNAFVTKHPQLEPYVCADQGIRLMNIDSRIAQSVIDKLTNASCPVLCVHDSLIVPYSKIRVARGLMRVASVEVLGKPLLTETSGRGLDEMHADPLHVQQDFIAWRQTPRCEGYLQRLAEHEERWGPLPILSSSSSSKKN